MKTWPPRHILPDIATQNPRPQIVLTFRANNTGQDSVLGYPADNASVDSLLLTRDLECAGSLSQGTFNKDNDLRDPLPRDVARVIFEIKIGMHRLEQRDPGQL